MQAKIMGCLNTKILSEDVPPLEISMQLNVIQDMNQDGNLFSPLSSAANDLLAQIYQSYRVKSSSSLLLSG